MIKNLFLFLIKIYQLLLSPQKGVFRNIWLVNIPCRFNETCSEFAARNIQEKGVLRGGKLAMKRIAKCHPFSNNINN